jgi:hypothetical protein
MNYVMALPTNCHRENRWQFPWKFFQLCLVLRRRARPLCARTIWDPRKRFHRINLIELVLSQYVTDNFRNKKNYALELFPPLSIRRNLTA